MNRRCFLMLSTTALVVVGCNNAVPVVPAQIVTDLNNGVNALISALMQADTIAPGKISTNTRNTINGYLTAAVSLLTGLSTGMNAMQGAPIVQQVETYINDVIVAAAAIPLIPPPFSLALQAAAVVLPFVETWLNSVMPAVASSASIAEQTKRMAA